MHDFDKAGFSIVGTLQRNTRRYSFRHDINAINLGLRLGDIGGLEAEDVYIKSEYAARQNLRKNGATEEEIEFLLERRVELNAFASDDFVEWIEGKLDEHGVVKVIPDQDTLDNPYRRAVEQVVVQQHVTDVADKAMDQGKKTKIPKDLQAEVQKQLREDLATTWDLAVRKIAAQNIEDR